MKASFAEIDITPPLGTHKIGWLKLIIGERIHDPLFARVAIFESGGQSIALVQLDTLCVRNQMTQEIRSRVTAAYGFPGAHILVSATHNHAGPAVATVGLVECDEAYCATLVEKIVTAFGQALAQRQDAQIGFGQALNWQLAKNRRVVMRDGIVKTHGRFTTPDALFIEGPIDPEVFVIAARTHTGQRLGALVNYSCHPTHLGGEPIFSAGWPGVTAQEMKTRSCPITMFLNGAQGQTHHSSPVTADTPMAECGLSLADSLSAALHDCVWRDEVKLRTSQQVIQLPYRQITDAEIKGTVRGAQRFIDNQIYTDTMPALVAKINARGTAAAEVQVLGLDEFALVSIPAELFVELGLQLKERAFPRRAYPVGLANGIVGYIPTREAFARGGYETTFGVGSHLAPEAGEQLVAAAVNLIQRTYGQITHR